MANWKSILGTVGTIAGTVLPLLIRAVGEEANATIAYPLGYATIYRRTDGDIRIGHLGGAAGSPILLNLTAPAGQGQGNSAYQLNLGQSLRASDVLAPYTKGSISIGASDADSGVESSGILGRFGYVSNRPLAIGSPITASVTDGLSLTWELNGDGKNLTVTASGSGTDLLGTNYWLPRTKNTKGAKGYTYGTLRPISSGDGERKFTLPLPVGIDYSAGLYDFTIQQEIKIADNSYSTDPDVEFEVISEAEQADILQGLQDAV
jgi:hypothetical protein